MVFRLATVGVLAWPETDFYKEEKGKKESRKRSVKSRVALLTSGTFNLQLERWCREFDSQISRPTEHHPQIVQRGLSARRIRWVFFLFPPSHLPGIPGMLPGCCHFHISANSVPYLKPQKRKVESGFWHGQKWISTKRKRGRKKVVKEA